MGVSRMGSEPVWLQFCQVTALHWARLSDRLPSGKQPVKTLETGDATRRLKHYINNSYLCIVHEG